MSDLSEHLRFFEELGVTGVSRDPKWRQRVGMPTARVRVDEPSSLSVDELNHASETLVEEVAIVAPVVAVPVTLARSAEEALASIRSEIGECTRCKLHAQGRTQIVFGVGNPSAELMFVGEGPGADEDVQGVPFVGRAGQLLTKMIVGMGFAREEVYIANVVKCRPPGNRNPEPDEIAACEPFLFSQIAAIQPKVVIALGAFAAKTLLRSDAPISRLRGRVYDFRGARLIPTFHPSFLLRSPGYRREAWEDLKMALRELGREVPVRSPSQTR